MFDVKPVMQHFLGKPVRFYPVVETMTYSVGGVARKPLTIRTWAIPLPDLAAVSAVDANILITTLKSRSSLLIGQEFMASIPDALGRQQNTRMLTLLAAKSVLIARHCTRMKSPESVVACYRWLAASDFSKLRKKKGSDFFELAPQSINFA